MKYKWNKTALIVFLGNSFWKLVNKLLLKILKIHYAFAVQIVRPGVWAG
jgi:hypothetical protein